MNEHLVKRVDSLHIDAMREKKPTTARTCLTDDTGGGMRHVALFRVAESGHVVAGGKHERSGACARRVAKLGPNGLPVVCAELLASYSAASHALYGNALFNGDGPFALDPLVNCRRLNA